MAKGAKGVGEAEVRRAIEEAGGFRAFGEQLEEFRACHIRLDKERAELTAKYPDMWVAMGKDGVAAVSDSHTGLLAEIDGRG